MFDTNGEMWIMGLINPVLKTKSESNDFGRFTTIERAMVQTAAAESIFWLESKSLVDHHQEMEKVFHQDE